MFGLKNGSEKQRALLKFFNTIGEVNFKKETNQYVLLLVEKLLPLSGSDLFTQDLFVLFVTMIQKLNSFGCLSHISKIFFIHRDYAIKVMEYLCSIYLSPEQT